MAEDLERIFTYAALENIEETGADFTYAALENIEETGADWSHDLERLREGVITPDDLLARCLEGADPDREEGWRDYVDGLVAIIPVADPEDAAACRADWIHDSERDDRATGDGC